MNNYKKVSVALVLLLSTISLTACSGMSRLPDPSYTQQETPDTTVTAEPEVTEEPIEEEETPTETAGQENARMTAEDYLNSQAFSRSGLIDQLKYEGYSKADATYGADAVGADWNEQAALCAEEYLASQSFSRSGLIDQLIYEGFTKAQATYGVNEAGL